MVMLVGVRSRNSSHLHASLLSFRLFALLACAGICLSCLSLCVCLVFVFCVFFVCSCLPPSSLCYLTSDGCSSLSQAPVHLLGIPWIWWSARCGWWAPPPPREQEEALLRQVAPPAGGSS